MKLVDATAADGDPTLQSQDNEKSLYLCLQAGRNGGPYTTIYDVHAIKLSKLICDQCSSGRSSSCQRNCSSLSQSELKLESPWKSIPCHLYSGLGVYGSSIVVAGGLTTKFLEGGISTSSVAARDVFTLETSDRKESTRPGFARFRVGKGWPIFVEVGDKLYALPGALLHSIHPTDLHNCFEVYEPELEAWSLLPPPPFLSLDLWNIRGLPTGFCVAVSGTSILVSWGRSFSFNTCTREWAELRIPSSDFGAPCSYLDLEIFQSDIPDSNDDDESKSIPGSVAIGDNPFVSCGTNLVIDHLMLSYDDAQPWTVSVFRICGEHSEFSFRLLQKLKLPQDLFPPCFRPDQHQLVHLGGQIVCLVLTFHCCFSECTPVSTADDEPDSQDWMVAAMFFEFNEKKPADTCTTDDCLDYKVLASHLFRSNVIKYQEEFYNIALRGAFVLDTNQEDFKVASEGE